MHRSYLKELVDSSSAELWMWIWFGTSAIAVGIIFGNAFSDDRGGFHFAAMLGGFVVGLISNVPLMAIFTVLQKILHSQHALHVPPQQKSDQPGPREDKTSPGPVEPPRKPDSGTAVPEVEPSRQAQPAAYLNKDPLPGAGGRGTAPRPSNYRRGSRD